MTGLLKATANVCLGLLFLVAAPRQQAGLAATPDELAEISERGVCRRNMKTYKGIDYERYCGEDRKNDNYCREEVDAFNKKIEKYNYFARQCREAARRQEAAGSPSKRRARRATSRRDAAQAPERAEGVSVVPGGGAGVASDGAPRSGGAVSQASTESLTLETLVRSAEPPRPRSGGGCVSYSQRYISIDSSGRKVTEICFKDRCCPP